MSGEIARVHVDDYDPEIYTGEDALEIALVAASIFRAIDFPDAVVGVSYNPAAAASRKRRYMASFGVVEEATQ